MVDLSHAEDLLRADIDARLHALQDYADAAAQRERAEDALASAREAENAAWEAVGRAGWGPAQLKALNVAAPPRNTTRKRSKRTSKRATTDAVNVSRSVSGDSGSGAEGGSSDSGRPA